MLTVEQALEQILGRIHPLSAERLPLLESPGRVLAEDVFADIDSPPFDNSAVDGYAVRAEDTAGASPSSPVRLRLLGEVPAGALPPGPVTPGGCMRVMTGAPIPEGANAMVMVEDTRVPSSSEIADTNGEQARPSIAWVEIRAPAKAGDHIRKTGEDVRVGTKVLTAGTVIGSAEVAMLAAMGCVQPLCIRPPKVAVISTGDEVIEIASRPEPGQIRDSNRYAMAALVAEAGGEVHSMIHLPDDKQATADAFRACAGLDGSEPADVIVTSGGVSVGDRDYVKPVLEQLGALELWRVKMKPGKPLAFGRIGSTLFFGLPGNPVSTIVTFELFVRPALWKMAGHRDLFRPVVSVTLTHAVKHTPGRREYIRARLTLQEGIFYAEPTGAQGSGILSSMLGANALVIVSEEAASLNAGDTVPAMLLSLPFPAEGSRS